MGRRRRTAKINHVEWGRFPGIYNPYKNLGTMSNRNTKLKGIGKADLRTSGMIGKSGIIWVFESHHLDSGTDYLSRTIEDFCLHVRIINGRKREKNGRATIGCHLSGLGCGSGRFELNGESKSMGTVQFQLSTNPYRLVGGRRKFE